MNSISRWLLLAVLIIGGVGATVHLLGPAKPGSVVEGSVSNDANAFPILHTTDSNQSTDRTPLELSSIESSISPARRGAAEMASIYAETMQTGVFGEESIPRFAELYLFPGEAAHNAAAAAHNEFFGSPIDAWSSRMEEHLRTSFGNHPLVTKVRVSIMCRSTQCKLQFVERTVAVQPEGELGPNSLMMISSVARESWFRENFSEWRTQAATPVTSLVAYQLVVLPRREGSP